jgi:hypothetical protein
LDSLHGQIVSSVAIIPLVLGALLLFFGRKLFWFFVGVAGFLAGMDIAGRYFSGAPSTRLLVALVVGIICAFLAVLFYKVAVAIAGFVVGGYLAMDLVRYLGISQLHSWEWAVYVIGGVMGAVLVLLLLDWALIVLSSFAGASMIVHSIAIQQIRMSIVYTILVILGILVQAGIFYASRRETV